MGNGASITSLIPGLSEVERSVESLQRLINSSVSLPDNIVAILSSIRDQLLEIVNDVRASIESTVRNINNAATGVQTQVESIAQRLIESIEPFISGVEGTLEQARGILDELTPSIPLLRELIKSLEDVPQIIKNLPYLFIAGVFSLLLCITIGILLYKFIMEGTGRLGIDHLLVLGAMMVILIVLLVLVFLYMKSQLNIILA